MLQIIPIKELKNTSKISERVHASENPIFITRNGYGDMVLMSIESYERQIKRLEMYEALDRAEREIASGQGIDAREHLADIKEKYGL